jgi:hypothetical protein
MCKCACADCVALPKELQLQSSCKMFFTANRAHRLRSVVTKSGHDCDADWVLLWNLGADDSSSTYREGSFRTDGSL